MKPKNTDKKELKILMWCFVAGMLGASLLEFIFLYFKLY